MFLEDDQVALGGVDFEMKANINVDADPGLVHIDIGTAAHASDVHQVGALLYDLPAFPGTACWRGAVADQKTVIGEVTVLALLNLRYDGVSENAFRDEQCNRCTADVPRRGSNNCDALKTVGPSK